MRPPPRAHGVFLADARIEERFVDHRAGGFVEHQQMPVGPVERLGNGGKPLCGVAISHQYGGVRRIRRPKGADANPVAVVPVVASHAVDRRRVVVRRGVALHDGRLQSHGLAIVPAYAEAVGYQH